MRGVEQEKKLLKKEHNYSVETWRLGVYLIFLEITISYTVPVNLVKHVSKLKQILLSVL